MSGRSAGWGGSVDSGSGRGRGAAGTGVFETGEAGQGSQPYLYPAPDASGPVWAVAVASCRLREHVPLSCLPLIAAWVCGWAGRVKRRVALAQRRRRRSWSRLPGRGMIRRRGRAGSGVREIGWVGRLRGFWLGPGAGCRRDGGLRDGGSGSGQPALPRSAGSGRAEPGHMMMDWVAPACRGAAARSFEAVRQLPRAAGARAA